MPFGKRRGKRIAAIAAEEGGLSYVELARRQSDDKVLAGNGTLAQLQRERS